MRKNKRSITLMILIAHMLIGLPASQAALAEAKKERLVDLSAINPHIVIDLKYATADNFLKEKVYDDNKCYVLESLAQRLDRAQKLLERDGLGLLSPDIAFHYLRY